MRDIKYKLINRNTVEVEYTGIDKSTRVTMPVEKFITIMGNVTNKILKELPLFELEAFDADGDGNVPYCLDDDTNAYCKDSLECILGIGMCMEELSKNLFGSVDNIMCEDNNLKEYNVANYDAVDTNTDTTTSMMADDIAGKWEPGDDWHLNNLSTVSIVVDGVRKDVNINECSIGSLANLSLELESQLHYGTLSTFKVDDPVAISINSLTLLLLVNADTYYDDPLETIRKLKNDLIDILTDMMDVPKSKEDTLEDAIWQDVECSVYTVLTHSIEE